jgi:hypothetical protein
MQTAGRPFGSGGAAPGRRAAFLASLVDPLPFSPAQAQNLATASPTDIETLEWFASPDDICRAFAGLQQLAAQPALAPIGSILSANNGIPALDPAQWPTIWYKGGSEPGVATMGLSGHEQQRPDLRGRRNAQRPARGTFPRRPRPDCSPLSRAPSGWSGNPARAGAAAREQYLSAP